MTYKDFCTQREINTFRRVKRRQMRIARVARGAAVKVLRENGIKAKVYTGDDTKKEYVITSRGWYRMAMQHSSDNKAELREHERLGAEIVTMGDEDEMLSFFREHDLDPDDAWEDFLSEIRAVLDQ